MPSSVVLEFNDFRLPCSPEMLASMGEAKRAKLERWCLRLKQLSRTARAVDEQTASNWQQFRATEPAKNSQPVRAEHLVRPGGSFEASVCLLLHYPSYNSHHINDGNVYDPNNPSISRLALSGFNDENALWLDRFCRRKRTKNFDGSRFQPNQHVEAAVLNHHHEFLAKNLRGSASKVVAIFGAENQAHFKSEWGSRLEELTLWGDHKDISLWMLFSEEDETLAERLVLFLAHPEHLNHSFGLPQRGKVYDALLGLVAQLGGVKRSEKALHYNETSLTDENKRINPSAMDDDGGNKWTTIKRRVPKNKDGLTQEDSPISVVCRSCRYVRCDITPQYYGADSDEGKKYSSPYTHCPACDMNKQFVPADGSPFVTRDDLKRNNKGSVITRRNTRIDNKKRKRDGDDDPSSSRSKIAAA